MNIPHGHCGMSGHININEKGCSSVDKYVHTKLVNIDVYFMQYTFCGIYIQFCAHSSVKVSRIVFGMQTNVDEVRYSTANFVKVILQNF